MYVFCFVTTIAPVLMKFEPVGRWFESRVCHVKGVSCDSSDSSSDEDDVLGGDGGVAGGGEINPLLLDPTQWKVSRCIMPIVYNDTPPLAPPISTAPKCSE